MVERRVFDLPLLLLLFALHTFLLMGMGAWSDLAMMGEEYGYALYYAREGMLAFGFLLYAVFAQWQKARSLPTRTTDVASLVLFALFAACVLIAQVSSLPMNRVPAVLVDALLIGISGGLVYESIALSAQRNIESTHSPSQHDGDATRMLGVVVGGGGALAVMLQYVLQTGFSIDVLPDAFFIAAFGATLWLVRKVRFSPSEPQAAGSLDSHDIVESRPSYKSSMGHRNSVTGSNSASTVTIVCLIVAAGSLFLLLPFYEAIIRMSDTGVSAFYEWHRLFLAAGYIVIGAASYIGRRHVASMIMLVSALLAIFLLAQTLILESGPFTMGLFYFLLGAAIAWSNIAFMVAATQFSNPALIASTGRILLVLATFVEIPIQALGELPLLPALIIELALFAAVMVSMMKGGFLDFAASSPEVAGSIQKDSAPSKEDLVRMLGDECDLSDRELEVLSALVLTEEKNQKIADDLGISRRQMQTYVSRIYEKTGTTTRAGLVMRIHGDA